ncbi:hypothetical protein D9M69_578350 [compost metagenome]
MSSSSCERCSATSATRVSMSATRAAASRTVSLAWRASVRASIDWAVASALWRASCSFMPPTFCHSAMVDSSAISATRATRPMPMRASRVAAAAWAAGVWCGATVAGTCTGAAEGGERSSDGDAALMRRILSTRSALPAGVCRHATPRNPRPARLRRCVHGWRWRARPANLCPAARAAGCRWLPSC